MNIALQRKLDRILGTFVCRLFSPFQRKRNITPAGTKVERILVILLSEMGSLVLAYPMFAYLKRRFPNASMHVLLFKRNKEILEILNVVPQHNILTLDNTSMAKFTAESICVLINLRKAKFDTVIDCELFSRISSIFSFLSGATVRVGFHRHTQEGLYRGDFINRRVLYNPYQHISHQFITLVDAIDSPTIPKAKRLVNGDNLKIRSVEFARDEIGEMRRRLYAYSPDIVDKKLVLIYPSGGLLPIRAWPLGYYCRLAAELLREGYAVGVIGLEDDEKLADAVLAYCQNTSCVDLTGFTKSLQELLMLFHLASLLITNDGGPGQFAAMTPVPTIVLFGPETPTLYGPLDQKAIIFYVPLTCSPCLTAYNHRNSPCDGDNVCLKSIHPGQVIGKALEILETHKGAPSSFR
jgi:ADP-heptose:LPS heptosyltransferase